MSVSFQWYNNKSDNNVINKNISALTDNVATFSYSNVFDIDTTTPYIKVAYQSANNYIKLTKGGYNYAYSSTLKKYYYVTEVKLDKGFIIIHLKTDVLMTYKPNILKSKQLISRSENYFNRYLNDPNYKSLNYKRIQFKQFPYGFSDNYKYLLLVGGGN